MTRTMPTRSARRLSRPLIALWTLFLALQVWAQEVPRVTTLQDANGWKLQVNGSDFFVKGVVWGYTPRGRTYSYSLWSESDDFVRKVLDHEFGLMQKAGVNAIRSFMAIPPKWVEYVYREFGIMTVVNPLVGRYGSNINGVWVPSVNYADPETRAALKKDTLEEMARYRNTPGVLMYALGNESNYGLSWKSFEIENLPVGEQQTERARYLYSLFGEIINEARAIAPDQLYTIVNGDLQYLDLIAEYGGNWDLLGTNVYRGMGFTDMWTRVRDKLNKPIVLMEFGSDAFNAKNFAEDQGAQATWLRAQWQEMYENAYGHVDKANSVGGFIFEWRDEWWKYLQTENLDRQDRTASWSNGGYSFDMVEGQNNMNEEWFGIMRHGELNRDGVHVAEPRMAYHMLSEIWKIDPYGTPTQAMARGLKDIDMDALAMRGDIDALKSTQQQKDRFRLEGGRFEAAFLAKGQGAEIDEEGEDGLAFSDGQMIFLDFAFEPTERISGDFTVNILGNSLDSDMQFLYGDRGRTVTVRGFNDEFDGERNLQIEGQERVEIYDFRGTYTGDALDMEVFYHVPRYHWKYEGDFFGLLRETTDMAGQDIWNDKAPYGVELTGKDSTEGLKLLFGPEVYWGANPKIMAKYQFGSGATQYAVMLAEDIARREGASGASEATPRQTRQGTVYMKTALSEGTSLELGGIISGTDRIGEEYDRLEGRTRFVDEIELKDTLGVKAKLSFAPLSGTLAYVGLHYAGLVADGGDALTEFGTQLPYSARGNKREIEGGIMINSGNLMIFPRVLWRQNIEDANPSIDPAIVGGALLPGINPRNIDDDPFAVLDNREAKAGEIYLTWDPTPATSFYDWNVDMLEDAPFAMNVGLTATRFPTRTDAYSFFLAEFDTNAAFGEGLAAETEFLLKSKMIFNPDPGYRVIGNLELGKLQSTGSPDGDAAEYARAEGKVIVDRKHIFSGYVEVDGFGQYDFYRQFNVTYPLQVRAEYAMLLDHWQDEMVNSQVGIRALYRTPDENSPADEYLDGRNDYRMEVTTYFIYSF